MVERVPVDERCAEIGRRLTAAQEARGWKNLTVAQALDIDVRTWQRWKTGQKLPIVQKLLEAADLLGIAADEIIAPDESRIARIEREIAELREQVGGLLERLD